MKKVVLILMLLMAGNVWANSDPNNLWLNFYDEPTDMVWIGLDGEESLRFTWKDGVFDVICDLDSTDAARLFVLYIEPYINNHIEQKAKELCKNKGERK